MTAPDHEVLLDPALGPNHELAISDLGTSTSLTRLHLAIRDHQRADHKQRPPASVPPAFRRRSVEALDWRPQGCSHRREGEAAPRTPARPVGHRAFDCGPDAQRGALTRFRPRRGRRPRARGDHHAAAGPRGRAKRSPRAWKPASSPQIALVGFEPIEPTTQLGDGRQPLDRAARLVGALREIQQSHRRRFVRLPYRASAGYGRCLDGALGGAAVCPLGRQHLLTGPRQSSSTTFDSHWIPASIRIYARSALVNSG
jgi:hypothetical protein